MLRILKDNGEPRILDETGKKTKIGNMDAPWYEVEIEDGLIGWSFGAFIDKQK